MPVRGSGKTVNKDAEKRKEEILRRIQASRPLVLDEDIEISDDENDENQGIDETNILMIGFVGVVGVALLLLILIIWFLIWKKKKKRNRKAFKGTNQVLSWDL